MAELQRDRARFEQRRQLEDQARALPGQLPPAACNSDSLMTYPKPSLGPFWSCIEGFLHGRPLHGSGLSLQECSLSLSSRMPRLPGERATLLD